MFTMSFEQGKPSNGGRQLRKPWRLEEAEMRQLQII